MSWSLSNDVAADGVPVWQGRLARYRATGKIPTHCMCCQRHLAKTDTKCYDMCNHCYEEAGYDY